MHMITDKIKELADLEAKTLELKKAIARVRASELADCRENMAMPV